MPRISTSQYIAAPQGEVFRVMSDPRLAPESVPDILRTEIIGDIQEGAGTRFTETRMQGKKEQTMSFEILEHEAPRHLRVVCEAGGAVWDSTMRFDAQGDGTNVVIDMDARPTRFMMRLMLPLVKAPIRKGMADQLDAVRRYCEGRAH